MSEKTVSAAAATIHQRAETGHDNVERARILAEDPWGSAAGFLRENPWVAVAGAAVLGGVLTALTRRSPVRRNSSRAAVRDWLEEAHASLPTKKQFKSMANSAGLPTTLAQLKERLREL